MWRTAWALTLSLGLAGPALAQSQPATYGGAPAAKGDQELAKQLANPVANLISLPLQLNYDKDLGTDDAGERFLLNAQPVVPIDLSEDWLVISRTVLPLIRQDDVVPGAGTQTGLGDTLQSLFFSPKGGGALTWGVGPVFLLPTATDDRLGSEKWGLGPTGVALIQEGPWTVGGLANHLWSVAGDSDRREVNQSFLQPFVNYTTPRATSFFLNTESSYDWAAEQWSVPVNFGVNQLLKIGSQRIQVGGGLRYWLDSPDAGPEGWGARLNLIFLFPK